MPRKSVCEKMPGPRYTLKFVDFSDAVTVVAIVSTAFCISAMGVVYAVSQQEARVGIADSAPMLQNAPSPALK